MKISKEEFFNKTASTYGRLSNYKQFVLSQVDKLEIEDLIKADLGGKDIETFRVKLGQFAAKSEKRFKTRVIDGELYVGRIK